MKKPYKKEYIDVKELDSLVPKEYRHKINLLFNKDIPKEPKNADELLLYRASSLSESELQQSFNRDIQYLALEIIKEHKFNYLECVKNDNGDAVASKLSEGQRMAFYARKKAEGFKSGFPDLTVFLYNNRIKLRDTMYIELKKICAPSEIHLTKDQLDWFLKLNNMGFDAYITNNPLFFKNTILSNIKNFFR